jgi:hypothetical protein
LQAAKGHHAGVLHAKVERRLGRQQAAHLEGREAGALIGLRLLKHAPAAAGVQVDGMPVGLIHEQQGLGEGLRLAVFH